VLGRPGVYLNTSGDLTLLPKILDAANRLKGRPADAEMAAMSDACQMSPLFV
jgi:hypothetical protein